LIDELIDVHVDAKETYLPAYPRVLYVSYI